ncbi:unnamed protein product [Mycena citricolor]|uniref:Mitochondrial dicarboxylate transporter n=1 Tax=Mycena citricolor TaxID=2018698 RepID=A0AAD2HQY2_9AGAR|nr:unnamed protein product [Mycena citricolor]
MTNTPFWLGGVAASLATSITHPLDFAKVRMQTIETAPGVQKPSIISVLRASIHESGIRSVYTGLTAAWLRQMSYTLVRIGTYEELKTRISHNGPPSALQLLTAASLAGALGGIAGNPAGAFAPQPGITSAVMEHRIIIVPDIVLARAVLMNASQVGSYDFIKSSLLRHSATLFDYQLKDNLLLHVISSLSAGAVATTVCSPPDVMRTRIMSQNSKASFLHVLTTSIREEGPRVLFKGWTPAFIRLGPQTVLMFVFFEQLKKAWINLHS